MELLPITPAEFFNTHVVSIGQNPTFIKTTHDVSCEVCSNLSNFVYHFNNQAILDEMQRIARQIMEAPGLGTTRDTGSKRFTIEYRFE